MRQPSATGKQYKPKKAHGEYTAKSMERALLTKVVAPWAKKFDSVAARGNDIKSPSAPSPFNE